MKVVDDWFYHRNNAHRYDRAGKRRLVTRNSRFFGFSHLIIQLPIEATIVGFARATFGCLVQGRHDSFLASLFRQATSYNRHFWTASRTGDGDGRLSNDGEGVACRPELAN